MHKMNSKQDRQENDGRKPSAAATGRVMPAEGDPGRFHTPGHNPTVESSVLKSHGGSVPPAMARKGR